MMKLFRAGITLSVAIVLMACGGGSTKQNPETEKEPKTEETATDKQTLTAGSYTNESLGYSITYPKDILVLQPETENTNEQVFLYKDGGAKLRIYKDERKGKDGKVLALNEAFEVDKVSTDKHQVSYNSLRPLFYTLSGVEDGKVIFYQKSIMAKGVIVTARLTYSKEEKPIFDAMIAPLFDSFK